MGRPSCFGVIGVDATGPRSLRGRRDALAWGVRSGGRIFEHTHGGKDQWEYFQASARQEHQFSRAMASVEHLGANANSVH